MQPLEHLCAQVPPRWQAARHHRALSSCGSPWPLPRLQQRQRGRQEPPLGFHQLFAPRVVRQQRPAPAAVRRAPAAAAPAVCAPSAAARRRACGAAIPAGGCAVAAQRLEDGGHLLQKQTSRTRTDLQIRTDTAAMQATA